MSEPKINHYMAVLADLKLERKELDSLIQKFEHRIAALKGSVSDYVVMGKPIVEGLFPVYLEQVKHGESKPAVPTERQ